jgi:hypothetical protein
MQGCGCGDRLSRANTPARISGITEAKILKRDMIRCPHLNAHATWLGVWFAQRKQKSLLFG